MRLKGILVEWNDNRGFGFLEPVGGSERVFCHISAFSTRSRRPTVGDRVIYELGRDEKGRARAKNIRPENAHRGAATTKAASEQMSPWAAVGGALAFFAVLIALTAANRLPWTLPAIYLCVSMLSILIYAFDKSAAMNRRWRTRESRLHLLALLGGWPGAWIAQLLFRHKTRKTSFVVTFAACVIANVTFLAWAVLEPEGAAGRLVWMAG
jgi:uncharacterized membrane protein YsdA (DUF1294 family)/cold shock CspA family protein